MVNTETPTEAAIGGGRNLKNRRSPGAENVTAIGWSREKKNKREKSVHFKWKQCVRVYLGIAYYKINKCKHSSVRKGDALHFSAYQMLFVLSEPMYV